MSLTPETRSEIEEFVKSGPVVLFMKGTRDAPQCGFSAQVVQILDGLVSDYRTLDVLERPEIRAGIKEYSEWPTIPQLYVGGEFLGGCDIIREMHASGELHEALGLPAPAKTPPPSVTVTDAARALIENAMANSEFREVHVKIDARFNHQLGFGPEEPGQIRAESNGVRLLFDPDSARRADGLAIDATDGAEGRGLTVDNPNRPNVGQLSPRELEAWLDAGEPLVLLDVRTPEERATAHIEGSELLDDEAARRVEALPRDTRLVFHCHSGARSQAAAERFAGLGFSDVHNLAGGIDAWSLQVDPSVPRY